MGKEYEKITIRLFDPDKIAKLSYGEVSVAKTYDAVSLKTVPYGLMCERIFGTENAGQCRCGQYKKAYTFKGAVCEKCGVEVNDPIVRRHRFGHISLAAPVVHPWFRKIISAVLNIAPTKLDDIIYCKEYIVMQQGTSKLNQREIITVQEYYNNKKHKGFNALTGGEAIKKLLSSVNIPDLYRKLRDHLRDNPSSRRVRKRLLYVRDFYVSGTKPEWMVLEYILVLPPALRPVLFLDDGTAASSDLNELYAKIIHRNNRLKKLIAGRAPDVMLNIEKGGLQEAVDGLYDNGRKFNGKKVNITNRKGNRPLKSLSSIISGKEGRLRKNLLGKRVDFSGRSQITVGPDLKLHQCGIPYQLALDIARPFVYHELIKKGYAATLKHARSMADLKRPEAFEALENIFEEKKVLLNRAPSLHKMSFQAFDPVLIGGEKVIRLHPLVCAAFNADFDGDQMGVHLPLTAEAQLEARVLMSSVNNVLSPANGGTIVTPSQDALFGIYYLTKERNGVRGENMMFSDREDVITAYQHDVVDLHARVKMRHNGNFIETTPGRVVIGEIIPEQIGFEHINKTLKKKDVIKLIELCFDRIGHKATVIMVDQMKDLGFKFATISGLSIGMDDMRTPEDKWQIINETEKAVGDVNEEYKNGLIDNNDVRYEKIINLWNETINKIKKRVMEVIGLPENAAELTEEQKKDLREFNSLFMMADSGARGNADQINLATGMCGLMPKPSGEILERPIKASLKEGLSYIEYLLMVHKGRKGRIDGPTKTPIAGYFTRRLVYAMQDVIIEKYDCGTKQYIDIKPLYDGNDEVLADAVDRAYGRVAAKDIVNRETNELILAQGTLIDRMSVEKLEKAGVRSIPVRSPLTCESEKGICAMCYGMDLSTTMLACIGDPVGIIAAQSIGEPGTQLTLRTFHSSGASLGQKKSSVKTKESGTVEFENIRTIRNREGKQVVIGKNGFIIIKTGGKEKYRWRIPYGALLETENGAAVNEGDILANWDPINTPILSTSTGVVSFKNIKNNVTMRIEDNYGIQKKVISDILKDAVPTVVIGDTEFSMPIGAYIAVEEGDAVEAGDIIARIPNKASKNLDITSGLPKVLNILDLVKPKTKAVLTEIDGDVSIKTEKGKYVITVENKKGDKKRYYATIDNTLAVFNGDYVKAGDIIVEGVVYPPDIVNILTPLEASFYIVDEVQKIYRGQGVVINDKHFEILVMKMLGFVEVTNYGDSWLVPGEIVPLNKFLKINDEVKGIKVKAKRIILGLADIALHYKGWLSAASFQETTRVLADAAIKNQTDYIEGIKENIIVGSLIPVGTGHKHYKETKIISNGSTNQNRRGRPKKTN